MQPGRFAHAHAMHRSTDLLRCWSMTMTNHTRNNGNTSKAEDRFPELFEAMDRRADDEVRQLIIDQPHRAHAALDERRNNLVASSDKVNIAIREVQADLAQNRAVLSPEVIANLREQIQTLKQRRVNQNYFRGILNSYIQLAAVEVGKANRAERQRRAIEHRQRENGSLYAAIMRHKEASAAAGITPEAHDLALWAELDRGPSCD